MISRSATDAPEAFGSSHAAGEERTNLELTRRYLAAIEAGVGGDASDARFEFFAPDVVQVEYPNQLVPKGAERNLAAIIEAGARGRKVLRAQRYEVRIALAQGSEVALEVLWVGTLAVPIGALAAGAEMRAHFGVFLTFRDGRIVRQHNYDCFEPF
jgi:ketosteroid isomerase-like protein